ncbi:ATP-binding protein [Hydrogenophaga sp.]|uniref:ATP-binding protein n=1 Tax=Hydrogenophaga sp. TaxID=1904254 RepID=UPI002716AC86|nr:ATP-binding protein [Hydrogenophaga sp.]MDO9433854.1 ATP-binding protein [Hydrogenophaga sp.]
MDSKITAFLEGGGQMAKLIANHDWRKTGLGPLADWPEHVKVSTSLMLRSRVPIVMLWGESGVMIYNDAYSVFAGQRHPSLLGSDVREGWPEVASFNDNVMRTVLRGDTLGFKNQELTLHRNGQAEQVWMNLDYSPVLDLQGRAVGVIAIVVETTGEVQALARLNGERERITQLFEQAPSFMTMLRGPSHVIELANPNYIRLIGHRAVIGRTVAEALPDAASQGYVQLLDKVYATGEAYTAKGAQYDVQAHKDGPIDTRYLDFVFQPLRNAAGEIDGVFVDGIDVTDRVNAELKTRRLIELADLLANTMTTADIAYAGARVLGEMLGVSRVGYGMVDADDRMQVERDWCAEGVASLAGTTALRDYGSFADSLRRNEFVAIADVRLDERTATAAAQLEAKSTRAFVNMPVLENGHLAGVFFVNGAQVRDWTTEELELIREVGVRMLSAITRESALNALRASEARFAHANENLEHLVAERSARLLEVESQFRQAQKMEAIGQLTGGLAHDFNNILGTLSNCLQLIRKRVEQGNTDALTRYVGMGEESVKRGAALTHRLLAFARRQTLDPKPVDVNQLVRGMAEMVRRTVGPAVQVDVVEAGGLWTTQLDPSQLENSLLNLCINARDAMPDGGRLTVETANKWFDDRSGKERDLPAGQYVCLSVTDTGTGMEAAVIERIFDPFYTTKPLGTGTGLGLSMVYGFVRQSGGQVRVYSELGKGTTMSLYLPRFLGEATGEQTSTEPPDTLRGDGETVLVVEDEWGIRVTIEEELVEAGYQVLTADNGPAALKILDTGQRVDLLVTDVGLPGGMNGRQLADAARTSRTTLKVLFITGYADNAAVGNGQLEPGMAVLTKPFEIAALSSRIKAMLLLPGA